MKQRLDEKKQSKLEIEVLMTEIQNELCDAILQNKKGVCAKLMLTHPQIIGLRVIDARRLKDIDFVGSNGPCWLEYLDQTEKSDFIENFEDNGVPVSQLIRCLRNKEGNIIGYSAIRIHPYEKGKKSVEHK